MRLRIRKRWLLITLVTAAEFVCLIVALSLFNARQSRALRHIVRQRMLVATQQHASQTAKLIDQMGLKDLSPDSDDWKRLQTVVETTNLPDEAFLCVIDDKSGRVLCHPRLRFEAEVKDLLVGSLTLQGPAKGRRILDLGSADDPSSNGWAMLNDGTHLIAVRDLPGLGAKLLAHQNESSIEQVIQAFTGRVWRLGQIVAVFLVLITAGMTMWFVRIYDNRLARINESLQTTVAERSEALLRSRDVVIFGLAKLAESRDDQTGDHLERICEYAEILARRVANGDAKLDEKWVHTVRETAALHDVGKVGIPDSVLLKPGPLTEDERVTMQKHPYIGGDTLMAIKRRWGEDPFLVTATQVVFGHHEKWDGSGYPFGLKGENIPLSARIVAVADVYDALTSERTYKRAFTHESAHKIVLEGSSHHFDPRIVEAFAQVEGDFRVIAERPRQGPDNGDGENGSKRTKPTDV